MSSFIKNLIWCVVLISLVVVAFIIKQPGEYIFNNPLFLFSKIFSIIFLLACGAILSESLRDMVAFKYKLTIRPYSVGVKYLTSWWLFIPCWKTRY